MVGAPGVPTSITKQILKICRQIDKTQKPYYVSVKPDSESQIEECFFNVKAKVERDGGQIQFGWQLWEWPSVMLWADFHAIWVSPEDEHIDITPIPGDEKTLFLPDSTQEYDYDRSYYRVPIRYFQVSDNPLVPELITVKQELFAVEQEHSTVRRIEPEGVARERHAELKQKEMLITIQLMSQLQPPPDYGKTGRNDPCPCESGKKFKKCCGKIG